MFHKNNKQNDQTNKPAEVKMSSMQLYMSCSPATVILQGKE